MTHQAKAPSAGSTQASGESRGLFRRAFATRGARNGSKGSGAPSPRRLRATLAVLALAIAAFAITAAPASAAPEAAKVETISAVSYTSAHVTGKVSSPGCGIICAGFVYSIQYSTDPSDQTSWQTGFTETLGGAADEKPVGGNISVPKGGTKYFVRLKVDTIAGASATSPEPNPSFTTLAVDQPVILATDDASGVFSQSAQVSGEVERPANPDPAFDVSDCRFEYITDADYAVQRSEVQELTVAATGGSFQLEFGGQKTSQIAFDASAATVQSALEALPGFPAGAIAVSGGPGDETASTPYIFTFGGALANQNAAQIRADGKELSGPGAAVNASTSTEGRAIGFEGAAEQKCEQPLPFETPEGKTHVTAHLAGLEPATIYHLRLAAENAAPTAATKEAANTFTTAAKVAAPTVIATDDATEIGTNGAKFTGKVKRPAGADPALDVNCHFEYITDAQFLANEGNSDPGFTGAHTVDCAQNPITAAKVDAGGEIGVSAAAAGLFPSTTYHLRLVAENAGGTNAKDAATTFATLEAEKPTVTIDPVASGTFTTAHVSGTIGEGQGSGTITGYFEFSSDGGASWSHSPNPDFGGIGVQQHDFTGLQPATTYLFRISAWHDHGEGLQAPFERGEVAFSAEESLTTEPLAAPTAVLNPVTGVTATTAHLSGTVDPHAPAGPLSDLGKKAYATHWEFVCTPECPPGPVFSGTIQGEEGAQSVAVDARNLETNTPYEVTLVVKNGGDLEATAGPESFSTPLIPPSVKSLPGGSDGEGGYILAGVVNPNHSEITSCHFEWGPNSSHYDFDAPCSPAALGNGGQPVTVEAHLTGLNPGAVYNADLVIESTFGKDHSGNFEFTPTLSEKGPPCPNEQLRDENLSLGLPECRAYERVTDGSKDHREGRAAYFLDFSGGEAVAYESAAPNIANSGQGNVFRNNYVSTRTPLGWETIPNLNGPSGSMQSAPEFASTGALNEGFLQSADLLSSIFFLNKDGVPAPSPYLRRPDGRFESMGPIKLEGTLFAPANEFDVESSDDLSHLLFNGTAQGSVSNYWGPGVYEFVGTGNDQPRRVDVDNLGSPITACVIPNHSGGVAVNNAISNDGRVIVVSVQGGCGGANPPTNELWARVGGATSIDVSASHCNRPDCNAPAAASFQGAAKDGSRVYFTTTQQLVNDDTDQTSDLYACDIPPGTPAPIGDTNPCSSFHQVSGPAPGAKVEEVLNVSDDGSSVYFTAKGVLADNEDALGEEALPGDRNLYAWRTDAAHPDGQTTFVARLPQGNQAQTTPDGRYLLLITASQLVATDTDSSADIYRYDADSEEMARVSTAVSGAGGNGEFDARVGQVVTGGFSTPHHSHFSISDNGQLIVFLTSEPLSPLDGNGNRDAYLWNAGHVVGSLGQAGDAYINATGQDIYIQAGDVYDVRINGGFPQPQDGCSGAAGACQFHSPGPAPTPVPATGQPPADPGNVVPKHCRKGKIPKGERCVKKPKKHAGKKHHAKKHKRANSNSGGGK